MKPTSLAPIALAAIVSACATPYGTQGVTGGYSESKISDSAYVVTFNGNGFTSRDRVYYFWVYRCAELTLQHGYSLYATRTNAPKAGPEASQGTLRQALYTSGGDERLVKTRGGSVPIFVPGGGGGATAWTFSATILMYKRPLPEEVLWAVDAEQVVAALKPYVTSNGSVTPPTPVALFKQTFTAHARITIGRGATGAVEHSPDASAQTADLRPVRPVEDIANTLDERRLVALQRLFRDHQTHAADRSNPADVVLQFTVSPNGLVKNCHATSTSVGDLAFSSQVEDMVRETEFGARDVASTTVSGFRIEFLPLSPEAPRAAARE